ncbi:MAG: WYL domain-containing protein [Bacteroidales bacterium]|jgi:hypothetical protein|nr:WYL domain-containing protein [Bacteroidales bacterium]
MTKKEIQKAWLEEKSLNPEGAPLKDRTFYNHIAAIREKYGVTIVNDEDGKPFHISNEDKVISRTLSDLLLKKLTNEYNLGKRILFEDDLTANRDKTDTDIMKIAEAMSMNHKIQFKHRRFGDKDQVGEIRTVHPYFIRMNDLTVYLVGYCEEHKEVRTFGVDERITSEITILEDYFKFPDCFDPNTYFETAVGVIRETPEEKPSLIRLLASPREAEYLRSKKFHSSQKEIATLPKTGYVVFEYRLSPTIEFYRKLFSYAGSLSVISPYEVVQNAMDKLQLMYNQHQANWYRMLSR